MRAFFYGAGIDITLTLDDKRQAEKDDRLECQMWDVKPKLVLHIVDAISEEWRGFPEEPWFHITAHPLKERPTERDRYDVYIRRDTFQELTNPRDPIIEGGYLVSRSKFDRVDIKYFGVSRSESS